MRDFEQQLDVGEIAAAIWPGRQAEVFGPGRCAMARTGMSLRGHFGGEPLIGPRIKNSFRDGRRGDGLRRRRINSPLQSETLIAQRRERNIDTAAPANSNGHSPAEMAQRIFAGSPYAAIRRLTCSYNDGELVIAGAVASFYLKQMAQIAVQKLDGVARISNIVEVSR